MRKIFLVVSLTWVLVLLNPSSAQAAFVTVRSNGQVIWNVLASSNLEVKSTAVATDTSALSLKTDAGKFYLNGIDVTALRDQEIVDIEERADAKRIVIGVTDNQFSLKEGGVIALTSYPLRIDPLDHKFSVKTESGEIFLQVLPREAVDVALRSRFLTKSRNNLLISNFNDQVVYKVDGEKVFDLLGMVSYSVPVTAYISVSDGRVVNIAGPEWFKVFGFLFA